MRAASRISSLFHAVSWTFSPILFSSQVYSSSISMFNIRFLCYRMPCLVCNIVGSLKIPDKRVNQNICATVSNSKQLSWNDRNVSNCNEMAGNVRNVTVSNCTLVSRISMTTRVFIQNIFSRQHGLIKDHMLINFKEISSQHDYVRN